MSGPDMQLARRRKLTCVGVHLTWATKHRTPCLTAPIRAGLFRYISGLMRAKRGRLFAGGGWDDHIHLYIDLPASISLSTLVAEIKTASMRWIRINHPAVSAIGWQRGFAAFSVDRRRDDGLMAYIRDQEQIHASRSSRREAAALARAFDLPLDRDRCD